MRRYRIRRRSDGMDMGVWAAQDEKGAVVSMLHDSNEEVVDALNDWPIYWVVLECSLESSKKELEQVAAILEPLIRTGRILVWNEKSRALEEAASVSLNGFCLQIDLQ